MEKIDLRKTLKHLYKPSAKAPETVDVPEMNFLMIDGEGDPNTSETFQDAVGALYAVSYTLKFTFKQGDPPVDWTVMPLEGLWSADDVADFSIDDKSNWKWTLTIVQPEPVTPEAVASAIQQAQKKKDNPALAQVRFEPFREGLSAQIMHIGPYPDEGPTIEKLHEFIRENGHELRGKHHEIYLGDPRRAAPEKLKTIIRQPMR
jgi:hypothetical protein